MKSIVEKISDLFCKITNIRLIYVAREKSTFKFKFANLKTKESRALYVHFTLKDPWFLPHYEKHFGKCDIPLAGWLFFYFGINNEGIIYPGDEKSEIKGNNGERYDYIPFVSRAEADEYHEKIKAGKIFFTLKVLNRDGTERLILHEKG